MSCFVKMILEEMLLLRFNAGRALFHRCARLN